MRKRRKSRNKQENPDSAAARALFPLKLRNQMYLATFSAPYCEITSADVLEKLIVRLGMNGMFSGYAYVTVTLTTFPGMLHGAVAQFDHVVGVDPLAVSQDVLATRLLLPG